MPGKIGVSPVKRMRVTSACFTTSRQAPKSWSAGTIAAFGALAAGLRFTSLGRRIRATVQNRPLAESAGISTRATDRLTFFLGSGLAGVAGVAVTLMGSISPNLGTGYIINAFLVVVVGGVGSVLGGAVAAVLLGFITALAEGLTSVSLAQAILLVAVVAFLQWKPRGLFPTQSRALEEA